MKGYPYTVPIPQQGVYAEFIVQEVVVSWYPGGKEILIVLENIIQLNNGEPVAIWSLRRMKPALIDQFNRGVRYLPK